MSLVMIKKSMIMVSVIYVVLLSGCEYRESYFVKLKRLEARIDSLEVENVHLHNLIIENYNEFLEYKRENVIGDVIDLYSKTMQKIGDGFYITELVTTENVNGIDLSGRLINSTSLNHKNICFKIIINDKSKEFHIPVVSSGSSTKFHVNVPSKSNDSKTAIVKYLSSSVSFYK